MHEAIGKQASMTEHEEYVRSKWDNTAIDYQWELERWRFFTCNALYMEVFGKTQDELWSAAYAFTVERERQIRDVEEEIELHKDWREILSGPKRLIVWERTADRLQTALAELRRGMR